MGITGGFYFGVKGSEDSFAGGKLKCDLQL